MEHDVDYKKAYDALDSAMRSAIHILSQARMGVALSLRMESGELIAEDESDLQADIDAFLRDHSTRSVKKTSKNSLI